MLPRNLCTTPFTVIFFFFNDTATTEIYTLSLHDALPIYPVYGLAEASLAVSFPQVGAPVRTITLNRHRMNVGSPVERSEEHTSELQSRSDLVCRLLLEKKNQNLSRSAIANNGSQSDQATC